MINNEKLRDKIQFIKDNISQLETISSVDSETFINDPLMSPASTRLLQISIEAMIDIANHIVARNHLGTPKTYRESMEILCRKGIIPKDKLHIYLKMIKFRNRAVHLYDDISDDEILKIIKHNLHDFEDFINIIVNHFFAG